MIPKLEAARLQLDAPPPRRAGPRDPRGVVLTASYEARPYGVGSAMPMAQARRKCPNALIVPPRFDRYQQVSKMIMGAFADFSPRVEALSLDEAFLDMTGSERLFGGPELIGRRMKMAIRDVTGGLTASVGLSSTKYVAKVASAFRKPDGLTVVPPEGAKAWLAPLPVSRLWGVDPRPKTVFTNSGSVRSAVWPRLIRNSFPPNSEERAFTFLLWPTRKIRDPCLARECRRALGQRTRSIGTSARRQILNSTCGDQPT